jgi:hypothetical protein
MKTNVRIKTLLAGISLLLFGTQLHAQFTPCNNPHLIVNFPAYSPYTAYANIAGVNYGCSVQPTHDYYAFKVCTSGTLVMEMQGTGGGSSNDLELVIYGPFTSAGNNCSQLTAPNTVGCGTITGSLLTVSVPSVTAGSFYVMAAHSGNGGPGIVLDNTGTALVDTSCSPQCQMGLIDMFCLASVDSATQKYKVTWPETPNISTDYYTIYKLDNFNVYQPIGNIPVTSLSEFIDVNSNPAIHTERYSISRTDSCGYTHGIYPQYYTEPLHLNIAGNQQNQVALNWNDYYCFTNPAINYIIYRGAVAGLEMPIDTVPAFVNAYMDLTPPAGINYYRIGATVSTPCIPMRAANNVALSNNAMVTVLAIGDQQLENEMINVFPNPANENLNITLTGHTLNEIEVYDASGRLTASVKNLETHSYNLNLSESARGYYVLHVKTTDGKFARLPFIRN